MTYSRPPAELIALRFSCRAYAQAPIPEEKRQALRVAVEGLRTGPLGSALRFQLLAAEDADRSALKGLGTYGVIRHPAGFLVGAATAEGRYLEDYGYAMETLILAATDLDLGTCWLGGFFTRGPFSRRIALTPQERIPAVASVGVIPDPPTARLGLLRRMLHADRRLSWEILFHDGALGTPLDRETAGPYAEALEMVRVAPSASNRQPWRVVRQGRLWHFLLQRTPGYAGGPGKTLLGREDMQRVDMGIAMRHFELVRKGSGTAGRWVTHPPALERPDPPGTGPSNPPAEYIASWEE